MDNKKIWLMVGVYVATILALVLFFLFLIKLLWAWTIPDLFPGAVASGLIAGNIGWLTAFKLSLFLGLLFGIAGVRNTKKRQSWG